MNDKTVIEVLHGVPTKESIQGLIEEFDVTLKAAKDEDLGYIYFSMNYGIKPSMGAVNKISWGRYTQQYIKGFIRFANSRGVVFGIINDFDDSTPSKNGYVHIVGYLKPLIDQYFDKSEEVRADHLLYEDTQTSMLWKDVSKLEFYITLEREKGRPDGKDPSNNCYGHKLKFVGFKPTKKSNETKKSINN